MAPRRVSFPESASSEDEESEYNYCCQAFSSVSSALSIRTQPSYLSVVPVHDAAVLTGSHLSSHWWCVSVTPLCAYLWLLMLMGFLHDYYLLFCWLNLALALN